MIYDAEHACNGDGQWHCPFSREWVDLMAGAVKALLQRAPSDVVASQYTENFLDEYQDARGLPLSWCEEEERRYSRHPGCCTAIYDYDSIPDVVITNGEDDWPLKIWEPVLTT